MKRVDEKTNEAMVVSVVIPTYNRKEKVSRLIRSVLDSTYKQLEIILVDDNSPDETCKHVRENFDNIENLRVIKNENNLLLAGSRNRGIREAKGDLIFLLDDDNVVSCDCIENLVAFMKNNRDVGIAGPIIHYLAEPNRIKFAGCSRNYYTSITNVIGKDEIDNGQFKSPIYTEDIPNSFIVRKEVFEEIGLFDENSFPIHYDEADLGKRCRESGYRVCIYPEAQVFHDEKTPQKNEDKASRFRVDNPTQAYFVARNRIIFHRKYSRFLQFLLFTLIFNWIIALFYLKLILIDNPFSLRKKLKIAEKYVKGIIDGYKNFNRMEREVPLEE